MPFIQHENIMAGGIPDQQGPETQVSNQVGFGTALKTAMEDIPIVQAPADFITDQILRPSGPYDAAFNPFAKENIAGYENYANAFSDVKNADDMNYVKAKINRELQTQDMLGNSVNGMAAQLIAGIADPVNFVPFLNLESKAYTMSKIGNVALNASKFATVGGASAVANEALRQSTQDTRSLSDSGVAVAQSALFTGLMGGAFGAFAKGKSVSEVEDTLSRAHDEADMFAGKVAENNGSIGAMSVRNTTLEQETLKNTFGLDKVLSFQDPVLRTSVSPSVTTRQIAQELAEQPLSREKNVEGIASPIAAETRMRGWSAGLATANEDLEDAFVRYRTGEEKGLFSTAKIGLRDLGGTDKLTLDDFADEVGRALRRGDDHEIPEVAAAAQSMRRNVFDPLKEEAISLKLLPEDVKPETAVSYLTRVYDIPKIVAERPAFEQRITEWLRDHQSNARRGTTEEAQSFARMSEADIKDLSSQITDTLVGSPRGRLPYGGVPLVRGPLKDRTLTISDAAIEPWLISDARKVSRIYTRSMSADVELTKQFGRADMQDQILKIKDSYNQLRNNVTDPKVLTKLQKQESADLRDITAMRDRMRGNYALPADPEGLAYRTARFVKNLNYLRLLGGMTLSAISDLGRTTMIHGLGRTFSDGLIPMVKNFRQYRLASNEVKLAGNALDMVLDERVMSLADVMDDYARTTKFERGIEHLSNRYGLVSLMAPWNAALKQFAGVVTQTRMLQAMENIGKAAPKEIERLAFLGIDRQTASAIGKQFKQFGKKDDGIYWANTSEWTDRAAATAYRAAMSKEVNLTIVTPGQDKPLFMSHSIAGLIGQFKSFTISSNQRVLMSGLQQRDMNALSGALLSVGLGMMSYAIRTPTDKLSNDWRQWVAEGTDRSGISGSFFDLNNILEKSSHGTVGLAALTGKQVSRYASRNVSGAILGPSVGLLEDSIRASGDAMAGEWNAGDSHAVRTMLPFQNLFYLRSIFDAAENGVNRTLGVPERTQK